MNTKKQPMFRKVSITWSEYQRVREQANTCSKSDVDEYLDFATDLIAMGLPGCVVLVNDREPVPVQYAAMHLKLIVKDQLSKMHIHI